MTERENQYPEFANVKLDETGIWSEIKISVLREYACAFTRISKAKLCCKRYCYKDLFNGYR